MQRRLRRQSGDGKAENARDARLRENEGASGGKIRGRSVDATQGEKMPCRRAGGEKEGERQRREEREREERVAR